MSRRPHRLAEGDVGAFTIYGVIDPQSGWTIAYQWWEVGAEVATPQTMESYALSDGDVVEDVHNVLSDVWALGWKGLTDPGQMAGQERMPF